MWIDVIEWYKDTDVNEREVGNQYIYNIYECLVQIQPHQIRSVKQIEDK